MQHFCNVLNRGNCTWGSPGCPPQRVEAELDTAAGNEIKKKPIRFHLIIYSCWRCNMEPPEVFVWARFRWLLPPRVWIICMEENLLLWPLEMKFIHKCVALSRKRREEDKGKKERLIAYGGESEICGKCLWLKQMVRYRGKMRIMMNIPKVRPFLSVSNTETLMHTFRTRRLDCYDAPHNNTTNQLQLVPNTAARVLMKTHITLILKSTLSTLVICSFLYWF